MRITFHRFGRGVKPVLIVKNGDTEVWSVGWNLIRSYRRAKR